jgi:hypothetical protein
MTTPIPASLSLSNLNGLTSAILLLFTVASNEMAEPRKLCAAFSAANGVGYVSDLESLVADKSARVAVEVHLHRWGFQGDEQFRTIPT